MTTRPKAPGLAKPPLSWWLLRDRARTHLRHSWRWITGRSRADAEFADLYVRVNDLDRLQERHAERSEQIARLLREAIEELVDRAGDYREHPAGPEAGLTGLSICGSASRVPRQPRGHGCRHRRRAC